MMEKLSMLYRRNSARYDGRHVRFALLFVLPALYALLGREFWVPSPVV
jgi:hypothetical protein